MNTAAVIVNGRPVQVLNTLSNGPDCPPHTYELAGGAYVYAVGSSWYLQERGQFYVAVTVEVAR